MFNLFRGKTPRAIANLKDIRGILDKIIPSADSIKALEELSGWLGSVTAAATLASDVRGLALCMVDEAAQDHVRALTRNYLDVDAGRLPRQQEPRLWTAIHGYWERAAAAFGACVEAHAVGEKGADGYGPSIALLNARALRAVMEQLHWQHMRHGPLDKNLWQFAALAYQYAETGQYMHHRVTMHSGSLGDSTPEQEFVRGMMLSASSPEGLLPAQIDIAERLIAHFSPTIGLTRGQTQDYAYCIDLANGKPPQRTTRLPQPSPTLRFFDAARAHAQLRELTEAIEASGTIPGTVNLGRPCDPAQVLNVSRWLALQWSNNPPVRRQSRHRIRSGLTIMPGLDGVLGALGVRRVSNTVTEEWIAENVNAGGFGAAVPRIGEWLKVGCLIALRQETDTQWQAGIVRRLSKNSPQRGSVGIQTLARDMAAITVRGANAAPVGESGVLLDPRELSNAPEARLLLRNGLARIGQNLQISHGGKPYTLTPRTILEAGAGYEVVRVTVTPR